MESMWWKQKYRRMKIKSFRCLQSDWDRRSKRQWGRPLYLLGTPFLPEETSSSSTEPCHNPECRIDPESSAAVNVKKCMQGSRQITKNMIIKVQKRLSGLKEKFESHLEQFRAILDSFYRILTSISNVSEEKVLAHYLLSVFSDMYEKNFYMVLFGVQFMQ